MSHPYSSKLRGEDLWSRAGPPIKSRRGTNRAGKLTGLTLIVNAPTVSHSLFGPPGRPVRKVGASTKIVGLV